jgi:inositol phosphorylceramide mannosyltransferase catalytic subunit
MEIPKLLHWIWFGDEPLPEQHRHWIDGWLELHPGWDHRIWTDANRPTFTNEEQFSAADNFAEMADIARYELLYRHGGVYVDTDTECLRSIEPHLDRVEAFAVEAGEEHTIQTTPMGATPRHPWLASLIERLPEAMETGWGNMHRTGPKFLTRVTVDRPDVTIFSNELFAPGPDRADRTRAYSIHHAARSWDTSVERYELRLQELVREDIEPVVPPGAVFVLVDKGRGVATSGGRRSIPFPERDGKWNGYPANDEAAVAELERLRSAGAQFIVFPAPMFFWLDLYPALTSHLQNTARHVVSNDRAQIFQLET